MGSLGSELKSERVYNGGEEQKRRGDALRGRSEAWLGRKTAGNWEESCFQSLKKKGKEESQTLSQVFLHGIQ
ncbi:hypothetical protein HPP92_002416 [Vanilla planifolia]|uniref:Uncharacterized protein n=1 Tax=Vanilla planifolia TaxID=51239 RepID=A0A835VI06_VANPL|nr:hypothetical protein HPP92_002416 [Vanilla planifolia]